MTLKDLIERASAIAGSHSALARVLDVPHTHVPMWLSGARPCPLTHQARMCELIGEDAREHVWQEVRAAMGKHLRRARGGVAMLLCAATMLAPPAGSGPTADNV